MTWQTFNQENFSMYFPFSDFHFLLQLHTRVAHAPPLTGDLSPRLELEVDIRAKVKVVCLARP